MIHINEETAIKLLHQAIEQRGGDYVYNRPLDSDSCFYVHEEDGQKVAGCIVGLALADAGIPLERMEFRIAGVVPAASGLLSTLHDAELLTFTVAAAYLLDNVQTKQDVGFSWQEAYDDGIKNYALYEANRVSDE